MIQEVINENAFLKDENRRLNNELTKHYFATVAKANLLDIIIAEAISCHQHLINVSINLMKLTN